MQLTLIDCLKKLPKPSPIDQHEVEKVMHELNIAIPNNTLYENTFMEMRDSIRTSL